MIRQRCNILDIAAAICSPTFLALGFVSQHRVHTLMKGLCRVSNSCKAGVIVAVYCVFLAMACALLPGSILLTNIPDASWDAAKLLDC